MWYLMVDDQILEVFYEIVVEIFLFVYWLDESLKNEK